MRYVVIHRPRTPRIQLAAALTAICLGLGGCGTSIPAVSPPTPSPPTPSIQPTASDALAFDFSGSAWRATSVNGQAVPAEHVPRLEFDWLGRSTGVVFTGCHEFVFEATFDDGRVAVGDLVVGPDVCRGPGSDVEAAFLAVFNAAEAWSVDRDLLTLLGPGGRIELARDLPPMGDPGRQLAEALRVGEWRILRAARVSGLDRLPPVQFADALFIAAGECGFSGDVRFGPGGALVITDVTWDTGGCLSSDDGRPALQRLLEAVTTGRPGPDGTVVLAGPQGEVILGH